MTPTLTVLTAGQLGPKHLGLPVRVTAPALVQLVLDPKEQP